MIMDKEGYFNHKTNTFVHITKNCIMDCNPKSYKYILGLEKEIERLNNIIGTIEKDIETERMSHWVPSPLYLTELMEKIKELKDRKYNKTH